MFFVRPFMINFLKELYEMYEIIIFTAATKEVKFFIKLNIKNLINY
jgi:hypothetical protein